MLDIKGRWALVTGASRGVGVRVAKALGENGCRVILHSRKLEGTKNIVEELKKAGIEAYSVAAELKDMNQVSLLIKKVKEITSDNLDILYNNAAIMTPYKKLYEPTVDEYMDSFLVNSVVPAKLCDAFIPKMIERNWGRVVNVTSGIAYEPQLMAYSCSKAALDRYVKDMTNVVKGTNVKISLLDPGWLRTDLGGDQAPNDPDSVLPGALVPVLLEKDYETGQLFAAQDYS